MSKLGPDDDPQAVRNRRKQAAHRLRGTMARRAVDAVLKAKTLVEAKRICRAVVDWTPPGEGTSK